MEEAGVRKGTYSRGVEVRMMVRRVLTWVALLRAMHTDEGDELSVDVHLPCAEGATEGGTGDSVRELRMSGMLVR